ncbi:hypothetical protein H0H93_007080 [Arthromyces matolae]|nr:hypothetical protein H0H93_007080 [Arthromyces matolae]
MLTAHHWLYFVFLITGALSYPVVHQKSGSGPDAKMVHPNARVFTTITQHDAPFYLARLGSEDKVALTSSGVEGLDYKYTWSLSASGARTMVFIVDTGIEIRNKEFGEPSRASNGWSFDNDFHDQDHDDFHEQDHDGFGTFCASMVGGLQFGVAKNVELVSVVVGRRGVIYLQHIIAGLDYVLEKCGKQQAACIALISLGLKFNTNGKAESPLDEKVKQVPAGYHGTNHQHSTSSVPGVITVGALDHNDNVAEGSNFGDHIDIWAMGDHVNALVTQRLEHNMHGDGSASGGILAHGPVFSASQIAGIIALIISVHGNMTPQDMKAKVIKMGIQGKIGNLKPQAEGNPGSPHGNNVMAHIPRNFYNAAAAA